MHIVDWLDLGDLGGIELGYEPRTSEITVRYHVRVKGEPNMLLSRVLQPADINTPIYELADRAKEILPQALLDRRLTVPGHEALLLKREDGEVRILVIRRFPSEACTEVVFDLEE